MRILIISESYDPDPGAGQRVAEAACALADRGHSVRVLARRSGARRACLQRAGIRVQRVWVPAIPGSGLLAKFLASGCFLFGAFLRAAFTREAFDVLLTVSTPPMCHIPGVIVSRLRRATHVFWCADAHPQSLIAAGTLSANGATARALVAANRWALRQCHLVIVVGRCMRELLKAQGALANQVSVVPMWHRDALANPPRRGIVNALRAQLGLSGSFVVMYSGNLGRMHHFETLLAAAERLRHDAGFLFLFSGAGPGLVTIRREAKARGLSNVLIHPIFSEEILREVLALATVHVITLRESAAGVSVPGKLYGIMAAGRAMIFLGPGNSEVALTIREEQCGFVLAELDTESLVRLLFRLRSDPRILQAMGARARMAFLQRYCASRLCLQLCQEIERAAAPCGAGALVQASLGLKGRPL